ncbi:MAG: hypothetical protein LBB34_01030 [Holosporales bacterium]|nr:hypothetical protein [Holosporales bacterium]
MVLLSSVEAPLALFQNLTLQVRTYKRGNLDRENYQEKQRKLVKYFTAGARNTIAILNINKNTVALLDVFDLNYL